MIIKRLLKGTIGQSLAEVVLIVIGVLVALTVDQWRADQEEKKVLQQHLLGVVTEIEGNLRTLGLIRDRALPFKFGKLEEVIEMLSGPEAEIEDPEALIRALAFSARTTEPWLERNSFDALAASESFHSPQIQELAANVSDTFEGPGVLLSQLSDYQGDYPALVQELLPARYQSSLNRMRSYAPAKFDAPVIRDDQPLEETVAAIFAEKSRLLRLARNEAGAATGKWYALTRIKGDFEETRARVVGHPLLAAYGTEDLPMNHEQLTGFAARYTLAWSSQDPASVAAFFAENGSLKVNDGEPAVGRAAITAVAQGFMDTFPDMQLFMDEVTGEGARAVYRWTLVGTNTGPGGTGKAVRISGYEEWTIGAGGLVVESLGHFDEAEYQRQLEQGVEAP